MRLDFLNDLEPINMDQNVSLNSTTSVIQVDLYAHDDWVRYIIMIFMTAIFVVGVPGNGLVIIGQCKLTNKTSTDVYILNLAVVDCLCAGINAPVYLLRHSGYAWISVASGFVCKLHYTLIFTSNVSSAFLLAAIAIDRIILTCHSGRYSDATLLLRAKFGCAIISLFSVIYSSGCFSFITFNETSYMCMPKMSTLSLFTLLNTGLLLIFIIIFFVTSYCYTKISIAIHRRCRLKQRQFVNFKNVKTESDRNTTTTDTTGDILNTPVDSGNVQTGRVVQCKQNENDASTSQTSDSCTDSIRPSNYFPRIQFSSNTNAISSEFPPKLPGPRDLSTGIGNKKDRTWSIMSRMFKNRVTTSPTVSFTDEALGPGNPNRLSSYTLRTKRITNPREAALHREQKLVNKTTLLMFLITAIFILTWLINWSFSIAGMATKSQVFVNISMLAKTAFMVNCTSNPVLYICMSSKFRNRIKTLFLKCTHEQFRINWWLAVKETIQCIAIRRSLGLGQTWIVT